MSTSLILSSVGTKTLLVLQAVARAHFEYGDEVGHLLFPFDTVFLRRRVP
jgi:hypothetical protein